MTPQQVCRGDSEQDDDDSGCAGFSNSSSDDGADSKHSSEASDFGQLTLINGRFATLPVRHLDVSLPP